MRSALRIALLPIDAIEVHVQSGVVAEDKVAGLVDPFTFNDIISDDLSGQFWLPKVAEHQLAPSDVKLTDHVRIFDDPSALVDNVKRSAKRGEPRGT